MEFDRIYAEVDLGRIEENMKATPYIFVRERRCTAW